MTFQTRVTLQTRTRDFTNEWQVLLAHAAEGAADEWRESLARLGQV